jgi:hypothetical protein
MSKHRFSTQLLKSLTQVRNQGLTIYWNTASKVLSAGKLNNKKQI